MGNFKKDKTKIGREGEKRAPKPPTDPKLAAIREQQILPVIQNLQSTNSESRTSAANLIGKLIKDKCCRKLLLREQIIRIVLEKIVSHLDIGTRADGWSILSSLAEEEEADFCVHLYRQDILVPIECAIKTIIQTIESADPPLSSVPQDKQDFLWNLTISIVNLLRLLAESRGEVVEAISELVTIPNFLFGLTSLITVPNRVQIEVLLCTISLTEDNYAITRKIAETDSWLKTLYKLKDSNQLDAVYACAVLHNIFSSMRWSEYDTPEDDMTDATLIPILTRFIEKSASDETNDRNHLKFDQALQIALDVIASIASSFQEAIEHASPSKKDFASLNGNNLPNNDIEMETENVSEEMNEEVSDADMEILASYEHVEQEESSSTEITLDRLVRDATPKILRMYNFTKYSDCINEHILAALNNIAWIISNIDDCTTHLAALQKTWDCLAQEIWDHTVSPALDFCTTDAEIPSLITSLAWAIARRLKGAIKLKENEVQKFMALYQASRDLKQTPSKHSKDLKGVDDPFQSLEVKCIGVLGNLARVPVAIEQNRQIGRFLITILSSSDVPQENVVESLNQIFDIYADSCYSFDGLVFWGDNLYTSLEGVQSKIRQMVKTIDKRKFAELRIRADEALLNLGRFLAYKRKEKANQMDILSS